MAATSPIGALLRATGIPLDSQPTLIRIVIELSPPGGICWLGHDQASTYQCSSRRPCPEHDYIGSSGRSGGAGPGSEREQHIAASERARGRKKCSAATVQRMHWAAESSFSALNSSSPSFHQAGGQAGGCRLMPGFPARDDVGKTPAHTPEMVTNRQVLTASRKRAGSAELGEGRLYINQAAAGFPSPAHADCVVSGLSNDSAQRRENVRLGHRQRKPARAASVVHESPSSATTCPPERHKNAASPA